jgi:hypothetical protein
VEVGVGVSLRSDETNLGENEMIGVKMDASTHTMFTYHDKEHLGLPGSQKFDDSYPNEHRSLTAREDARLRADMIGGRVKAA